MGYHEAFWVTAGTVAPVVGLAHVVAIARNLWRVNTYLGTREPLIDALGRRSAIVGAQITELEVEQKSWKVHSEEGLDAFKQKVASVKSEAKALDAELTALEGEPRKMMRASLWAMVGDVITAASWTACAFVLTLALQSLANGRDGVSPSIATALLTLAAASLVVSGAIDLLLRNRLDT
jgi:hypothetical protein